MGSSTNGIIQEATGHYSQYLPDLTLPRFTSMSKQDAQVYAQEFKEHGRPPWLYALWQHWRDLFNEPFKGVTADGKSPLSWLQRALLAFAAIESSVWSGAEARLCARAEHYGCTPACVILSKANESMRSHGAVADVCIPSRHCEAEPVPYSR